MMKKILLCTALLSAFGLAACGGKEEFDVTKNDVSSETNTNVKTTSETEKATGNETETNSTGENSQEGIMWENEIGLIASSEGGPSDKYSKLEDLLANYKASGKEDEEFKNEIISDYESKRYLADPENDEYMLSFLLKTYVIAQNNEGTPLGDFATIMNDNLKITYLGEENKESDTVKANEVKMDESLGNIQAGS